MSLTTTSTLSPMVQQSANLRLLSVPVPYLIHLLPAELKRMPANGGQILRQRRYSPLPTAPVPLGNSGQNPPPTALNAVNIDVQVQFYGQFVALNEQVKVACYKSDLIDLECLAA